MNLTKQTKKNQIKKSKINRKKLKELTKLKDLEELLHLKHILNENEIEIFLKEYKSSKKHKQAQCKKTHKIILQSNNYKEINSKITKELISLLEKDYKEIKKEIKKRSGKKDRTIELMKLSLFPKKIKLFEINSNKKDFYKAKNLLDEIKKIIN